MHVRTRDTTRVRFFRQRWAPFLLASGLLEAPGSAITRPAHSPQWVSNPRPSGPEAGVDATDPSTCKGADASGVPEHPRGPICKQQARARQEFEHGPLPRLIFSHMAPWPNG